MLAVALALAASGCSGCWGDRHLSMPSASPVAMPTPTPAPAPEPTRPPVLSAMPLPTGVESPAEAPPPQRYEGSNAAIEAKVGEIEALGPDRSEAATTSLLHSAESASLLISAAAIRGLTGRGCDRVQPLLVRLLDDSEWQRRAWAAKVLGDNGCRESRAALVARAGTEQDTRVRSRLDESIRHLQEGKK
jgi:hypothetical protein